MKKNVWLLGFLLSLFLTKAQNPQFYWADHMKGPSNYDRGNSIVVDSVGNSYVVGQFQGAMDFDPSTGTNIITASSISAFIQKLDSSGNLVWVKTLSAGAVQILLDKNYNLMIRGVFSGGTLDFDPGPAVYNLSSYNGSGFILKLDRSGNFISAQNALDNVAAMCIDNNNNIYLAGRFSQTSDFDPGAGTFTLTPTYYADLFVVKLDPTGNFLYAKKFGSGYQNVKNMKVDLSGNIYIAGLFSSTADFDPGPGVYNLTAIFGTSEPFLVKLNAGAGLVWANAIHATKPNMNISCESMDIDELGNTYMMGFFKDTVDFDPGPAVYNLNNAFVSDYICRINSDGSLAWAKQMGNAYLRSLSVKKSNVYLSFENFGYLDVDFSSGVYSVASNKYLACILSVDTLSNFNWIYSFEHSMATIIFSFDFDKYNNIYSTGEFRDTCDFNPSVNTNLLIVGNSTTDIFVCKTGPCSNQPVSLPVNVTPNQLLNICPLKTTTLTVSSSDFVNWYSAPASSILLSHLNSFKTPVLSAGTYTYYASAQNCNSTSPRIPIIVYSSTMNPVLTFSNVSQICMGSSANITVNGANTYTWNTGAVTSSISITPTVSTIYTVTGTDLNNCSNTQTINVSVNQLPVVYASSSNSLLCSGQTATLTAGGAATYTWSTNSNNLNISVSPTTTTSYTVNGTDVNGCSGTSVFTQSVSVCTQAEEVIKNVSIQLIPNPTDGLLTINSKTELHKIEVVSITGQVLLIEVPGNNSHTVNLGDFSNGIYFVNVYQNNRVVKREKIILNK